MPVRLSFRVLLGCAAALALPFAAASAPRDRGLQEAPVSVTTITAGEIRGPSPLETAILGEINTLRRDPAGYVVNLRGLRGRNSPVDINAAIEALERAPPVSALTFNPSLSSIAIGHANYLGPIGQLTHTGFGGSTLGSRFRDQGWITTLSAEELVMGPAAARELVVNLIIDAGVPGAPHRADLLNPVFTFAGVGCAPHIRFPAVCVINLSNSPMAHQEWVEAMFEDDLGTRPGWRRKPGPPVRTPPREYGPDDSLMDAPWPDVQPELVGGDYGAPVSPGPAAPDESWQIDPFETSMIGVDLLATMASSYTPSQVHVSLVTVPIDFICPAPLGEFVFAGSASALSLMLNTPGQFDFGDFDGLDPGSGSSWDEGDWLSEDCPLETPISPY